MITEHKDSEFLEFLFEIVRGDHIDNKSNFLLGVFVTLSLLNYLFRLFPKLFLKLISLSTLNLILFSKRLTLSMIRPADTFGKSILAGSAISVVMLSCIPSSSSSLVISVSLWLRIPTFLEAFLWQCDHLRLAINLTLPVDICSRQFFADCGVLEILLDQLEACLSGLVLGSTDLIKQLFEALKLLLRYLKLLS